MNEKEGKKYSDNDVTHGIYSDNNFHEFRVVERITDRNTPDNIYSGAQEIDTRDVSPLYLDQTEMQYNMIHLIDLLREYRISIEQWGEGTSKTINHLYQELLIGESRLIKSQHGELLRLVEAVGVDVFYCDHTGQLFHLREDRQVLNGNRQRRRRLEASIAEKITPGEDADAAAVRAVTEELGISGDLHIKKYTTMNDVRMSNSYPGLISNYRYHLYALNLLPDQYNPRGYIERQEDKETFFNWNKI